MTNNTNTTTNINVTINATAEKIILGMLTVICSMLDRWDDTIGFRLAIVGSSYTEEGFKPLPEKFSSPSEHTYTSDDVYDLYHWFHETIGLGMEISKTYYSSDQVFEKFAYLDAIKAAHEAIGDIMKSPMFDKLLTSERQAAVAARASSNS